MDSFFVNLAVADLEFGLVIDAVSADHARQAAEILLAPSAGTVRVVPMVALEAAAEADPGDLPQGKAAKTPGEVEIPLGAVDALPAADGDGRDLTHDVPAGQ